MTTNKLRKNYTFYQDNYQLKLPLELDHMIPDNDCVRLLSRFVEEMDLSEIYATYSRFRENQATPRQMLKILLYAYHEGIYSSRKIEKACRKNVDFMYLLEGKPVPDHSTIARFRSLHFAPCAEKILAHVTDHLKDLGEISGKEIFIDGTKMEACANRYTFVWKKAVTKNQKKRMEKMAELMEECVEAYGLEPVRKGEVHLRHLKKLRKQLLQIARKENIIFVHGTGKRKTQLQRHLEAVTEGLEKLKEYGKKIHTCGERNSYSKTDPDATFMRMKEDHMKNGQLKPAYNLQIGSDSGYIAWLTVSSYAADTPALKPFLSSMHENISFRYEVAVTDSGYESEENYTYLEEEGIEAVIKPSNYEISKKTKFQNDISRRENMTYNRDGDYYVCANGKRLYAQGFRKRKLKSGYIRKATVYRCHECSGCEQKNSCIKGNNWKIPLEDREKHFEVSRKFERQREASLKRITSERGIILRINRSIYSEGVFAMLKENRAFRRFLCRGNQNVLAESILMAVSHNIGTLHRRIQSGKTGFHLYKTMSA